MGLESMLKEKAMRLEVKKLDQEIAKRTKDQLDRIEKIELYHPLRTLEEANSLVPSVHGFVTEYMDALKPWKGKNNEWNDTEDLVSSSALKAAMDAGRSEIWNSANVQAQEKIIQIMDRAGNIKRSIPETDNVKDYMADSVCWEVVKDLPGFEKNPYHFLIDLIEMGLKPTYFKRFSGVEKFVVDIPLKVNDTDAYEFGCWVYGDNEILWRHGIAKYCNESSPIKPPVRDIE
jgi:hypothetical protein